MPSSKSNPNEVYDLDAVLEREADREPFPFRLSGEVIELPNAGFLTPRQGERMMTDLGGVLAEVVGEEIADRLMDLPSFALQDLSQRWMRHAGMQPGDFNASRT